MRKLIVSEFVSLDGVMEDPGGAEKTKHGGWTFKFMSPEGGKYKLDELLAGGALLLGRVTYQGFAKAWPSMKDDAGFADRMNSLPKYVVSTTLDKAEWKNSRVISGNVAEEVKKLKEQPGQDILVFGSAELVMTLMNDDLVDEYRLMVYPIILGSGKRLFGDDIQTAQVLDLADSKAFGSGVVLLTYRPRGGVSKSEVAR
ncbi:MAG: dihydrofolate reductase family protein [Thaumarchaeota archaeon]|nr:dihydrofolate reductase family protein [Nitrososphaerota archaeon]